MINVHGDDTYLFPSGIRYNFSSNVPQGIILDGLKEHIAKNLHLIEHYPEPQPYSLEQRIAEAANIAPQHVSVTNGATEALYIIAHVFYGARSAILEPTFAEYEGACRVNEHTISHISSLNEISDDTELAWLCNPNNPTGSVMDRDVLLNAIKKNNDCIFVVDQSYSHFTATPTLSEHLVTELPNLVIVNSLTKHFGIPGLRVGYAVASSEIASRMQEHRMPWSVNALAIEAAHYALNHTDEIAPDRDQLRKETEWLSNELTATGLVSVQPSTTNFFLARMHKGSAKQLKEYLARKQGILIRDASSFHGLTEQHFRIATQSHEANEHLVNAIKLYFNEL